MKRVTLALSMLFLLLAPSAMAATSLGDATSAASSSASGPIVFVQPVSGTGDPYTVPSAGVLTSVRMVGVSGSGTSIARVLAFRPITGTSSQFTVVGGADIELTVSATPVPSAASRIPVKAGDVLGAFIPSYATLGYYTSAGSIAGAQPSGSPPADGTTVTFSGPGGSNTRVLVAATLEPDVDADGYGDESQDSCPGLAQIHAGPCQTDLQVAAAADPAAVQTGQLSVLTATVTNAGAQIAFGAAATLSLPAGLETVSASTTSGDCTGTTCALGDIPAGAKRKVVLVVRATKADRLTTGFAVGSSIPETAPTDNAASATVTATDPPATPTPVPSASPTPDPVASPSPSVSLCTVPKLKGRTKAKAKAALTKAGCRTGAVRGKKGKVRSQTIPAGTKVLAGTKVGFRIRK